MLPKHLKEVKEKERVAFAPYNFVELPEKVVPGKQPIPAANTYHSTRYTGWIDCQLETSSPLYIRCGLTSGQFLAGKEAKELSDFFTHPGRLRSILPGSSLRGMLRSLIEIISFGKVDQSRIDGRSSLTFRAVAAKTDDPLGDIYKKTIKAKTIKAGYLLCEGDRWYIQPAVAIEQKPFVWIRDDKVKTKLAGFVSIKDNSYYPQYVTDISFGDIKIKNTRPFAEQISRNPNQLQHKKGVLVTSGNMAETGGAERTSLRKNHCLVGQRDSNAERLLISPTAIRVYRETLTEFQQDELSFLPKWGALLQDRCIFYCLPQPGQPITLFGHSPNFRIPYFHDETNQAITIANLIPGHLRDSELVDLADAIFGYVRPSKVSQKAAQAGRVFVSDAICEQPIDADIWLSSQEIMPQILSGPKLTTFQHYLVQDKSTKKDLKHYASQPGIETIIRGHKLYWHKGESPSIEHPDPVNASPSQTTKIRPIKPGVKFKFKLQFENLRDEELGALLWLLNIAQDDTYRLSLGMGKPLGMGAIKIESILHLSNRRNRYSQLFSQTNWGTGETVHLDDVQTKCIEAFETYILDNIDELDHSGSGKATVLQQLPRIQMLLAMLQWKSAPSNDKTRYMTIEPNEYKDRPVLPTPFQVLGDLNKDTRNLSALEVAQIPINKPIKNKRKEVEQLELSERQKEVREITQIHKPAVGQVLDATVINVNGKRITYEMLGGVKKTVEEHKLKKLPEVGQQVKVEIIDLKDNCEIKKVKLVS